MFASHFLGLTDQFAIKLSVWYFLPLTSLSLSLWCLASTPAMLMKSLNTLSHKQLLHRECPSGVIKYLWTNIPSKIYDYFLWFVRVDIIRIDVKIASCFKVVLPINLEILSQLFKHLRLISKTCQYTIVFFYLLLNHNTKEWSAI